MMKKFYVWLLVLAGYIVLPVMPVHAAGHIVTFCGEPIPVSNDFVANKLMNVIRKMVPVVNMPRLRADAYAYFPYIESQLRMYGLPEDFKYLPIVESKFQWVSSKVGARGWWQIMPETARGYGMLVNALVDERDDVQKSTMVACKLLTDYYKYIFRTHKMYSWVLTAAAYNYGNGNITKAIRSQGNNYFTMNLNPETAEYVYRIIAVKELFENPELYMKNFGYNIFSVQAKPRPVQKDDDRVDTTAFQSLSISVGTETVKQPVARQPEVEFLKGEIKGKYKDFEDGSIVEIELKEDLLAEGSYRRRGNIIRGKGYIIDDKIMVDLGFDHAVQLYAENLKKGIPVKNLKNKEAVFLRVEKYE